MNPFDIASLLIVLAAFFGYINHVTLRLPFAIGMTVGALMASIAILAIDTLVPSITLAAQVTSLLQNVDFTEALMHGMLSFLLFAGALHVDLDDLKSEKLPILALASIGVILSTVIMATGAYFLFDALSIPVPYPICLVFGSLIAPTDPVAVLGIMRAAGANKEHEVQIVGESLFNDGVGVVLFTVLVAFAFGTGAHGGELTPAEIFKILGVEVFGGIGMGLVAGYFTYRAMRSIEEANIEILLSVALVMGVTTLALSIHSSAPLACVVAGLFIGNVGRSFGMSEKTQLALDKVWHFIDELLNAVLFLLIGLTVLQFLQNDIPTSTLIAALILVPISLLARFLSVLIPTSAIQRLHPKRPGTIRVLTWGGLKGGISIALALSLPKFEGYQTILTATYAVVLFSIIVQGLTVGRVIQAVQKRTAQAAPAKDPA